MKYANDDYTAAGRNSSAIHFAEERLLGLKPQPQVFPQCPSDRQVVSGHHAGAARRKDQAFPRLREGGLRRRSIISCDSFTMRLNSLSLIFSERRMALSAKSSINSCIADLVLATVAIRTFRCWGQRN